MNIVLYTNDFEPITVFDLPMWAIDMLKERSCIRVPVPSSPSVMAGHSIQQLHEYKVVQINCEWMVWKDRTKKMILTTDQDELALLLIPGWLPGQRAEINRYKKEVDGLSRLLLQALGGY